MGFQFLKIALLVFRTNSLVSFTYIPLLYVVLDDSCFLPPSDHLSYLLIYYVPEEHPCCTEVLVYSVAIFADMGYFTKLTSNLFHEHLNCYIFSILKSLAQT